MLRKFREFISQINDVILHYLSLSNITLPHRLDADLNLARIEQQHTLPFAFCKAQLLQFSTIIFAPNETFKVSVS